LARLLTCPAYLTPSQTPLSAHTAAFISGAAPPKIFNATGRTSWFPPRCAFVLLCKTKAVRPADFGGAARRAAFRQSRNAAGGYRRLIADFPLRGKSARRALRLSPYHAIRI